MYLTSCENTPLFKRNFLPKSCSKIVMMLARRCQNLRRVLCRLMIILRNSQRLKCLKRKFQVIYQSLTLTLFHWHQLNKMDLSLRLSKRNWAKVVSSKEHRTLTLRSRKDMKARDLTIAEVSYNFIHPRVVWENQIRSCRHGNLKEHQRDKVYILLWPIRGISAIKP